MKQKRTLSLGLIGLLCGAVHAQLVVDPTLTPVQLVQDVLLGTGVTVSNVAYNGVLAPGTAQIGSASFVSNGTNLGLASGVVLSTGDVTAAAGPGSNFASGTNSTGSDPDLQLLSGQTINDRAVLEFDFVPVGDTVKFRYVFGSEEYPEYACSDFNDAFGFFLSGPGIAGPFQNNAINIALIPGSNVPIAINTVNAGVAGANGTASNCAAADPNWTNNSIYYVDNQAGLTIVYDGFTVVLEARHPVQCGQTYHIKMAIGDGTDSSFDSGVFLEAGSFTSTPFIPTLTPGPGIVGTNTILESCYPVTIDFTQTGASTDTTIVYITTSGTATAGVDFVPALPDSLVFFPGQDVQQVTFTCPVDADGTETLTITLVSLSVCSGVSITNSFEFFIESSPPVIIVGGLSIIPCMGSTVLTPVVSGGFEPYDFHWSNDSTTMSISVAPLANTVYTGTVTDDCGNSALAQFFVELEPLLPIGLSLIGNSTVMEACESTTVNIVRPAGIPGDVNVVLTYNGPAGNGPDFDMPTSIVIPDGSENITIPFEPFEDHMDDDQEMVTITATFTDACGRTVHADVAITIIDAPPIIVEGENVIIECAPDSVQIFAIASGGVGSLDLSWSNGYQGYSAWVTRQVPGSYTVTATDDCGRTEDHVLTVALLCDLVIPNVITPNGDGHNDAFKVEGITYLSNSVRIFDRWGKTVLDVTNYSNQWKGDDLPDGTYYYEIIVSQAGKPETHTGHLTILRNGW